MATYTDGEIDSLLDECTAGSKQITLQTGAQNRYAESSKLKPYLGGLFLPEELKEITNYNGRLLPIDDLPRVVGTETPLQYRQRVYGPYRGKGTEKLTNFRYAAHRGQTKLCAIELEAITMALKRHPDLKYVLYAGAAPGEHIPFLAELFPALEFHLIDPAEFRVHHRFAEFPTTEERIICVRSLFTKEIAKAWAPRAAQTIFFSDIRSGDHNQDEFEREVWMNMQMQLEWWQIINPAASLFKFRLPYTDGATESKCEYPDGKLLLQPCGPNTSTEGRLFVWAGAEMRKYDSISYENYYFWLNTVIREWASFDHGLPLTLVHGLCHCFDCSRVVQIFQDFVQSSDSPILDNFDSKNRYVAYLIGRMITATQQRFFNPPHGDLVETLPVDKRLTLIERHGKTYDRRRRGKIKSRSQKIQHAKPVAQKHVRPPGAQKHVRPRRINKK